MVKIGWALILVYIISASAGPFRGYDTQPIYQSKGCNLTIEVMWGDWSTVSVKRYTDVCLVAQDGSNIYIHKRYKKPILIAKTDLKYVEPYMPGHETPFPVDSK